MYDFKDTTIQEWEDEKELPISAMNYDGIFLERYIKGYETLSVFGREMISVDIASDNLKIGSRINSYRLPPRVITVNYKLVSDDPLQLMKEYRKLMNFLYREEQVEIYFNDEADVIYEGVYQSSLEVPGDTLSIVSNFQILCESPLKRTTKTFTSGGIIGIETPLRTTPLKITCKLSTNMRLEIKNKYQAITLRSGLTKTGDVVVFDFLSSKVFVNGDDKTSYLELDSDFENFEIIQGDRVFCSNGAMEIEFKGVTL